MKKPKPVTIRGVTYPSISAAARAHGVRPSTIHSAMERGRLDYVGVGSSKNGKWNGSPVVIRGVTYSSLREAARALGVSPQAVSTALMRGTADNVGLRKEGQPLLIPPRRATRIEGRVGIPFSLGGFSWPSRQAASVALGWGTTYLGQLLNRGREKDLRVIAAAVARYAEAMKGQNNGQHIKDAEKTGGAAQRDRQADARGGTTPGRQTQPDVRHEQAAGQIADAG